MTTRASAEHRPSGRGGADCDRDCSGLDGFGYTVTMDISFLLPTKRSIDGYAAHVINAINSYNNRGHSYEILVYSGSRGDFRNTWFYHESVNHHGGVFGYNYLFKQSRGKYIVILTDDIIFTEEVFCIPGLFQSDRLKDRRYKIFGIGSGGLISSWVPNTSNPTPWGCPQELIGPQERNDENSFRILCTPAIERETIEDSLNGYVFHPDFRHHFCDNWLSCYIGLQGEKPIVVNEIDSKNLAYESFFQHDAFDYDVFARLVKNWFSGNKSYV